MSFASLESKKGRAASSLARSILGLEGAAARVTAARRARRAGSAERDPTAPNARCARGAPPPARRETARAAAETRKAHLGAAGDARNAGLIVPIIRTCLATTPRCMRSREASPVAKRGSPPLCERDPPASKRQSRVALWRRLRPGPVGARRATAGTRGSGERVCARTCCGERARGGAGSRRDVSEKSKPPTENLNPRASRFRRAAGREAVERKLWVTDRRQFLFFFQTETAYVSVSTTI